MSTPTYAGPMGRPPGPPATTKTIRIHDDLLEWAERKAIEKRTTLTSVINQTLDAAKRADERGPK